MQIKKKVLIFTYTDLSRDSIVLNQINWLSELYELHVVCNTPIDKSGVSFLKYPSQGFLKRNLRTFLLKLKLFERFTWSKEHKKLIKNLSGAGYELIIVHHLKLLPLAFAVYPKAKILFYAHEYYMRMYDHSLWWKFFIKGYFLWLADKYLSKCDYTVTVTESIKELYEKDYGIKAGFIQNRVKFVDLKPAHIDPLNIKILHHGLASGSRKLELMVELMKYLDNRFSLTMVLQTNSVINDLYIRKIKKLSADNPKIIFKELVKYEEVAQMGNEYDIGIFIMPPTTLNEIYSLGHKIFQFIQSRLMLVISPLPEMKKIVDRYNLGIYQEDFNIKKLAEKMNKLTAEEIYSYKCESDKHAKDLGSEASKIKFLEIISSLV